MKALILVLLISLSFSQDELYNKEVSEEYLNNVIGNMTELIKEAYVYYDFYKAPKQPKPDYIPKMDLVEELNKINRTNRKFFDFYAEVQDIISRTEDGHFSFISMNCPEVGLNFADYLYCIPFEYYVEGKYEGDTLQETFLSIKSYESACRLFYDNDTLNKIEKFSHKKIKSINNMDPYKYLEKITYSTSVGHSPQHKFINALSSASDQILFLYPHKLKDLAISIQFEGEEETFETQYALLTRQYPSNEFREYYYEQLEKVSKYNMPFPSFKEIERDYKAKMGFSNFLQDNNIKWDLEQSEGKIKCRVDTVNEVNVFYQNSFSPSPKYFSDYEGVMLKCFDNFYKNKYPIIIIESNNGGGMSELCLPFAEYTRPKISKPLITSMKSSKTTYNNFLKNDENLNPHTCHTYTEKDNILDGIIDTYADGETIVEHNRTKDIESLNIYEKKIMEKKRKEYLKTNNIRKPTEILIFTDGFSFSCTSLFIKRIQVAGHGIIAGYSTRPGLDKKDFDASQSNSGVETFKYSENSQNLKKLGFDSRITFMEIFDENDKETPKTPMEFLIYPVDEISTIYKQYTDENYNIFINEAKRLINKYNNEDGECNPENKYLYFETSKCDSMIGIDKAHGGYVCGTDGKWNKSACIPAYCDDGYYLNNERTKCIPDPCEEIKLHEITINQENEKDLLNYIIEPDNVYIFSIEKENYSYYFYTELENPFIYVMNSAHVLEAVNNGTKFQNLDKIYFNYYLNITDNTTISIKIENNVKPEPAPSPSPITDEPGGGDKVPVKGGLSTLAIALIVVGCVLFVIIVLIVVIVILKKKKLSSEDIDTDKAQQLTSE